VTRCWPSHLVSWSAGMQVWATHSFQKRRFLARRDDATVLGVFLPGQVLMRSCFLADSRSRARPHVARDVPLQEFRSHLPRAHPGPANCPCSSADACPQIRSGRFALPAWWMMTSRTWRFRRRRLRVRPSKGGRDAEPGDIPHSRCDASSDRDQAFC